MLPPLCRISLPNLISYYPVLDFWEENDLLIKIHIVITHLKNASFSLHNFCITLKTTFYAYKTSHGFNHFILYVNLPPSVKSLILQIAWVGLFLQGIQWLSSLIFNQLIVLLLYINNIISVFFQTGDLALVLKYTITDFSNLIYWIVCNLDTCLYDLLSCQRIESYSDSLIFLMCCDYLFMIMVAIVTMICFNICFRQPESYMSHIMLALSSWLLYNLVCLIFGGGFYPEQDWETHIDNLCNVSQIIMFLVYILLRNLERFVVKRCGGVLLSPILIEIDPHATLIRNLFFIICLIIFLITSLYSFIDIHNINNVNSGYVYSNIDLLLSYRWLFETFAVSPEILFIKILVLVVYNLYSFYKIYFIISFYKKYKLRGKKTT